MGKRGPAPKPTALRIIEGNPSKRPLNPAEPRPRSGPPAKPDGLSKVASVVWDQTVPELARIPGLLTKVDGQALAAYCESVARWKAATELVNTAGVLIRGREGGQPVKNPAVQIAKDAEATMLRFAREFGLTPASRSGIELPEVGNDDLEALLA